MKNVLFFLTPKNKVAYIYDDCTLRQGLEKMEYHKYSAIPVIDKQNGHYKGTITEGDFLWTIKNEYDMNLKDAEQVSVKSIKKRSNNKAVGIHANMEDLMQMALNQNFVPVINEDGTFMGIVTRKDIMKYCFEKYINKNENK